MKYETTKEITRLFMLAFASENWAIGKYVYAIKKILKANVTAPTEEYIEVCDTYYTNMKIIKKYNINLYNKINSVVSK